MTGFYARDLAYVHDAGFGDFARSAAPGLLRLLARAGVRDGLVVDLGCGSGIWARALTDAGYEALGVDASAAMLALARRRAPRARFVRGSAFDVELPRCDAVTAMGEVLGYSNAARAGSSSLGRLFTHLHRVLRPGGLLVFDLAAPGREPRPRRAWHEGEDWIICIDVSEDRRGSLVRRQTLFRRSGRTWRRSDECHVLTLHEPGDVLRLLSEAGFAARRLRGYGAGLRFRRGLAGFAARKGH